MEGVFIVKKINNANDYTDWLNELFDALELHNPVNLVGLSYGGWITSQYALQHPNRLNKVVLIAPVGTVMQLSPKWIARAVTVAIPLKYFTKSFMYWLAADTVLSGDEGKVLVDEHIDESFLAIRSFQPKQMVNPSVLTDEELQSFKVPMLFIVGANEKIFSAQEAIERLQNIAPQIQTKIIPNAGHDVTMAQAETVDIDILMFLSQ